MSQPDFSNRVLRLIDPPGVLPRLPAPKEPRHLLRTEYMRLYMRAYRKRQALKRKAAKP